MVKQVLQYKVVLLALGLSACTLWSAAEPVPRLRHRQAKFLLRRWRPALAMLPPLRHSSWRCRANNSSGQA